MEYASLILSNSLFAIDPYCAVRENSYPLFNSFFIRVMNGFTSSFVTEYTSSGKKGIVIKSYISAIVLPSASLRTRPLLCIYSLGFVVLARIKAVLILGILTPSSKHFIATIHCKSPSVNCRVISFRCVIFSLEVK